MKAIQVARIEVRDVLKNEVLLSIELKGVFFCP